MFTNINTYKEIIDDKESCMVIVVIMMMVIILMRRRTLTMRILGKDKHEVANNKQTTITLISIKD